MPKEFLMDILKAQREASEKYAYFLLAGVSAAIGFAANQTKILRCHGLRYRLASLSRAGQ
jgi:hypothetical protein